MKAAASVLCRGNGRGAGAAAGRRRALLARAVSLLRWVGLVSAAGAGVVGPDTRGDLVDRRLKGREIALLLVKDGRKRPLACLTGQAGQRWSRHG
ncbi:MAG: hypothetical protein R6X34_20210 [Chloroflexota bacterium]